MPGQFINKSNSGNFQLLNTNNTGNALFSKNASESPAIGPYTIFANYSPAVSYGWITIPDHASMMGVLDPNLVGTDPAYALYINAFDGSDTDQSANLIGLVGNSTQLTLSWGMGSYVTYNCSPQAFEFNGGAGVINLYYDSVYGSAPFGSISVFSSSGTYTNEAITITYITI